VRRTYARIYLISNASAPGPGSRRANAVPVNQHLTGVGASMARQRKDRLVQLQSAQCALCGITLPISLMMPDGGQACADIRWYCKDARSCTERWTARPSRQLPALDMLAEQLGINLGDPIHHQRDHDQDRQRQRRQMIPHGRDDGSGNDRTENTRRAALSQSTASS